MLRCLPPAISANRSRDRLPTHSSAPSRHFDRDRTVHDIDNSISVELIPLNHRSWLALDHHGTNHGDDHEAFGHRMVHGDGEPTVGHRNILTGYSHD
jgi:hypothetical protein